MLDRVEDRPARRPAQPERLRHLARPPDRCAPAPGSWPPLAHEHHRRDGRAMPSRRCASAAARAWQPSSRRSDERGEVHAVAASPADATGCPAVQLAGLHPPDVGRADSPSWSERFRVIRYDTRGHGASPVPDGPYSIDDLADDVVALLDRLGVERAHVVGLSLGGMTAMRLAARNPDRVDRLVLLCTGAQLPPADAWTDRAGDGPRERQRRGGRGRRRALVHARLPRGAPRCTHGRRAHGRRHPGRGLRRLLRGDRETGPARTTFRRSPRRRWRSPAPTTRPRRRPSSRRSSPRSPTRACSS